MFIIKIFHNPNLIMFHISKLTHFLQLQQITASKIIRSNIKKHAGLVFTFDHAVSFNESCFIHESPFFTNFI
jgi:hypothetical protein